MKRCCLLSLFLLLGLEARATAPDPVQLVALNQVFTVGKRQWFGLNGTGWAARVDRIIDSRCPVKAQCLWAGDAQIFLSLGVANSTKPKRDGLNTISKTTLQHRGVTLEVLKLEPERGVAGPVKITFRFKP